MEEQAPALSAMNFLNGWRRPGSIGANWMP